MFNKVSAFWLVRLGGTGAVRSWERRYVGAAYVSALLLLGCGGARVQSRLPNVTPVSITVDRNAAQHTLSPLLLGEGMEWKDCGNGIWDCANNTGPRPGITSLLQELNLGILRYPGGTLSDFFHWQGAVGPYATRQPQINPFLTSDANHVVTQMPYYGPDEFAAAATALRTEMLITANAGSGTAQEAAAWLAHYDAAGISARYWEIGNEVYMGGEGYGSSTVYKTPEQYAAIFDTFAAALRAVNPNIKVGALGCHDTGAFNLCTVADWNRRVLTGVHEKIDFLAIHNSYAPAIGPAQAVDDDTMFRALLASTEYIRSNMQLQASDVRNYAQAASQSLFLAITEHAPLFVPGTASADDPQLVRDRCLGSALFTALTLNVFFSERSVGMGVHINPNSPVWQAAVQTDLDGFSHPVRSAYFYVVLLYSAAIRGQFVPVSVQGAAKYSSIALGIIPALTNVSVLDAIGAVQPDSGTTYLYVVNRDLHHAVTADISFAGFSPGGLDSLKADTLNGPSYLSCNTAAAPGTVSVSTVSLPAQSRIQYTFPPHSLTRFTAK
jgi:alpha-L-arabinofuranosidase